MADSRIYTRTGDAGETGLVDGSRVMKHADRVEAYGTLDEANSWVGAALSFIDDAALAEPLTFLQHRLYNCSSNVATPPAAEFDPPLVDPADIQFLETAIDRFQERAGAIQVFVLPGGTRSASLLHVARTVCRRAERRLTGLAQTQAVDAILLKFVNRASDFLFAAARYANATESGGSGDLAWDKNLPIPS